MLSAYVPKKFSSVVLIHIYLILDEVDYLLICLQFTVACLSKWFVLCAFISLY